MRALLLPVQGSSSRSSSSSTTSRMTTIATAVSTAASGSARRGCAPARQAVCGCERGQRFLELPAPLQARMQAQVHPLFQRGVTEEKSGHAPSLRKLNAYHISRLLAILGVKKTNLVA